MRQKAPVLARAVHPFVLALKHVLACALVLAHDGELVLAPRAWLLPSLAPAVAGASPCVLHRIHAQAYARLPVLTQLPLTPHCLTLLRPTSLATGLSASQTH
eukprot:351643-Pleurochrysis_carterae.AAC.1